VGMGAIGCHNPSFTDVVQGDEKTVKVRPLLDSPLPSPGRPPVPGREARRQYWADIAARKTSEGGTQLSSDGDLSFPDRRDSQFCTRGGLVNERSPQGREGRPPRS